jgi:chemosensory pili system protein ChpA (sensor histidine kinase/response regulator)
MDTAHHTDLPGDSSSDLSALAWVQEELRKSLDTAHKALRRCVKDAETSSSDVDDIDPAILRGARLQIHQGVGVLELVNLEAGATLLRASEAAVQRFVAKPQKLDAKAVDVIEHASFALLDYIARLLGGKPVSPVALFPQYEALQAVAGAERAHPADLWTQDWQWRDWTAPAADVHAADAQALSEFESALLALMRNQPLPGAASKLAALSAGLAAGSSGAHAALWRLGAGFFEALSLGRIKPDVHVKRAASRLLAHLRGQVRGDQQPAERLAQDLLFFSSQAGEADASRAPNLAAARQAYGLRGEAAVDYTAPSLGRYDPSWIAQARKRVSTAKEAWSAVAGGELMRLSGLNEQFSLVGESLKKLYPQGETLADALQHSVSQTVQSQQAPAPSLAMEIATSVLYLEASLEDGEFDSPQQGERVQRLAQRMDAVRGGATPEPLEAWMEELYRRVSDRQTMGSVVQELRASLSEAEKRIDQFFRNTEDRAALADVPSQLQSMRGVFSVLGLPQASQAVLRMRDDIDALMLPDTDVQQAAQDGVFDRLASNLGALGFLIDMLSVQPNLAKSLFEFDSSTGLLKSLMGQRAPARPAEPQPLPEQSLRLIDEAQSVAQAATEQDAPLADVSLTLERLSLDPVVAEQPALAASVAEAIAAVEQAEQAGAGPATETIARGQVAQAMADFVITMSEPMGLDPLDEPKPAESFAPVSAPAPLMPVPAAVVVDTGLEEDDEMRGIFLEEAREVIATARDAMSVLRNDGGNIEQLTTVRRAFHTLKGSSRMVGLNEFGEAGWACEQLYNSWLATQQPADENLLGFTSEALDSFEAWVDEIEQRRADGSRRLPLVHSADALRLEGRRLPLGATPAAEPAPVVAEAAPPLPEVPVIAEVVAFDEPLAPVEFAPAVEVAEAAEFVEPAPLAQAVAIEDPLALDGPDTEINPDFVDTTPGNAAGGNDLERISLDLPSLDEVVAPTELDLAPVPAPVTLDQPLVLEGEGEPVAAELPQLEEPVLLDAQPLEVAAEAQPEPEPEPEPVVEAGSDDQVKVIGDLRIGIPLFNVYLNEADEQSRALVTELSEWSLELDRPVSDRAVALAHSLGGNSATVGFTDLSQLARQLEHTLARSQVLGQGQASDAQLFCDVAEEIRRLLHQFAAGFLKSPQPELIERLNAWDLEANHRQEDQLKSELRSEEDEFGRITVPSVLGDEGALEISAEPFPAANESHIDAPVQPVPFEQVVEPVVAQVIEPVADFQPEPVQAFQPSQHGAPPAFAESTLEAYVAEEASHTVPAELGLPEFRALEELAPQQTLPQPAGNRAMAVLDLDDDIDAVDAVDADLFPIFEEEALELLPQLANEVRDLASRRTDPGAATACMRTLHTLKGGARLAGAMRLGEMAHRMESALEKMIAFGGEVSESDVEDLQSRSDSLAEAFENLRNRDAQSYEAATSAAQAHLVAAPELTPERPAAVEHDVPHELPALDQVVIEQVPAALEPQPYVAQAPVESDQPPAVPQADLPASNDEASVDWSRFGAAAEAQNGAAVRKQAGAAQGAVRVRAQLLDRLVNQAGEVIITRSRLASEVGTIKTSLGDLTENLERLRQQLRDIELQAETQMSTRMEAARAASQSFDPLEFDRFTRFQELTRMMAESVNDVATIQRSLHRTLDTAEDQLVAQARLTRDLQDDLLRTRMVEFEGLSDRLYRVVRQAAKETGKQVRLDIVGGATEVDRGVLERMTPAFEHLLRNCVTHGIEMPDVRQQAGKEASGLIVVSLRHEGNEVSVEFRDDGAGLNLNRILEKGRALGMVGPYDQPSDAELAQLIFMPGFSTAETVTELAGRGIGMDVVRNEVNAMGGRIETATSAGQGTSFKLVLPLTTAVTQVVMLRCGETSVAVPTHLIEIVLRAKPADVEHSYGTGAYTFGDQALPFFWFGALLQHSARGTAAGRSVPVVIARSARQRVALHVDEVLGNQEVVVKNLGPQLARLPGLAGMTLLASGSVALIYNPVALATVYGEAARALTGAALHLTSHDGAPAAAADPAAPGLPAAPVVQEAPVNSVPLVLVVDDSLTVRRVTQRLLQREGYRVTLAKDGLDALERLAEERPQVVLSDIEMPRMDGFDLVRNIRSDAKLADLPVIMITSRIAQKHRDYAVELGVNHYLGKPYSEEELLGLIGRYTALSSQAASAAS